MPKPAGPTRVTSLNQYTNNHTCITNQLKKIRKYSHLHSNQKTLRYG